mgnify:FL=1
MSRSWLRGGTIWGGIHVGRKKVPYFGPLASVSPGRTNRKPARVYLHVNNEWQEKAPSAVASFTPSQARRIATILEACADFCEQQNRKVDR